MNMTTTAAATRFPAAERATQDEQLRAVSMPDLVSEVLGEFLAFDSAGRPRHPLLIPKLTYGAWRRCRGIIYRRMLVARQGCPGVAKPLLWTSTSLPSTSSRSRRRRQRRHIFLRNPHVKKWMRWTLSEPFPAVVQGKKRQRSLCEFVKKMIRRTPPGTWPATAYSDQPCE